MSAEDDLRAQYYRLLSRLLVRPPNAELLQLVAQIEGADTPLGEAVDDMARAAADASPDDVDDEYHELFIGLGRGELVPFGSYYQAGFLMEKPLAKLRQDMAVIGVERAPDVSDPEDHIASLCEIMAGLIDGTFGAGDSLAEQGRFFDRHIAPWGWRFFGDLESAESAKFFKPVGAMGREFLAIESAAFEMAA